MRRSRAGQSAADVAWSCDDEDGTVVIGTGDNAPSQQASSSSSSSSSEKSLSDLYEKIKVLKRGSQGVVYLARRRLASDSNDSDDGADGGDADSAVAKKGSQQQQQQQAEHYVAIKRMFSDAREERTRGISEGVLREIGILSMLSKQQARANDTNNVPCYASDSPLPSLSPVVEFHSVCCTKSGEICLVMEACAGDVMSFVQSIGKPPLDFVAHIIHGMLRAVKHLHENGVEHRDLKPSQLLVRSDGSVAVADLGSARFTIQQPQHQEQQQQRTQNLLPSTPGSRRTTLPYRAPEILLGDRHYCGRALDMWGVGVTFAELLRGAHLFTANTEMQTLTRIFSFIGTPTERSWPEYGHFPLLRAFNFAEMPPTLRSQVMSWRGEDFGSTAAAAQANNGGLAEAVVDLLEKLMSANPAARPSVDDCLSHRFFDFVPGNAAAWTRWKDDGDMPSKKPTVVSLGMPLGLGGGLADIGDDDDDKDVVCL